MGSCEGNFGGASLTFDPGYGNYTWTLLSPALGTPIPVGASITAEFSVSVGEDSECNTDTIDATASESRDTGSRQQGDTGADLTDSWIIRSQSALRVVSVVTPGTVYRAQTNIPVDITVENTGDTNSAAWWDTTTFQFSNGTYQNIVAPASIPLIVYAGTPITCRYYVDVDSLSATGPAEIDAWISYRDVNQLIPTANNNGAITPGNWTIVAGVVTTYRDAARTVPATTFNQGNYSVFARAMNLAPSKEHRLRWYDPNGVEVASSNPAITTSESGSFDDELRLTPSSPQGAWRVEGTQAFDYDTLCVSTFTVGAPPLPSLTLQLPDLVTVGTTFVATLTFANLGSATILDAEPASLTWAATNTGTATWLSGPSPSRQSILGETEEAFTYTLAATSAGNFQLQVSAYGFDENASTSPLVTAATVTSNICVIQPPPDIVITGLSELYDNVTRGQEDLIVRMTIANNGSAGAYIGGASLSHSLSGHTQTVASPTSLPYLLTGGRSTTFVFHVDVSDSASTGIDTISGSLGCYDADNASNAFSVTGGTANWTVTPDFLGMLSANSSFSPEQYIFNTGQRIYAKFTGLPTNKDYNITVYGPTGAQFGTPSASSNGATTVTHDFDTSTGATGTYKVDLILKQGFVHVTTLYFTLEKAGRLNSILTLSPASVDLGATVTATLYVWNPVASGSTIQSTTPTTPAVTSNSSGAVVLLSGPSPASASISPFTPATFTWVFLTTANTSTGSLSMIASATGTDVNSQTATTTSSLSNSLTILQRSLKLSSDTIELGSMSCNSAKTVSNTQVENLGNAALTNVFWQTANFAGPASTTIDRTNLAFSPANGFSVALSGKQNASATLSIPYNTPTGSYIATCGVYDDYKPTDGTQSLGEPQDSFLVTVSVTDTALVVVSQDQVDLGSCAPGSSSATGTVSAFNGGNLNLTNLTFSQTTATLTNPITFSPASFSSLATNGSILTYISANIDEAQAEGTYIATCTLSSDQATDTFQALVRVGTLGILVSPDPLDLGTGTPSVQIANIPFTVEDTGTLSLSHLKISKSNLTRTGGGTIPGENITVQLPSSVAAGATANATMSLYVAAGIPAGEYTGTQVIYEDLDNDNSYSGDTNEAYDSFVVKVTVVPYGAIDVVNATLELGSLPPGTSGQAGFLCRNIGSIDLSALSWVKTDLTSNAPGTLSATSYSFLAPATVAPGETFVASIAYTIPADQTNGEYYGANCRLYNDGTPAGLDAADPQDSFAIHCRIGLNSLNIIETTSQVDTSFPTQTTEPVEYSFTNNGTLVLNKPCATMTTDLTSGVNTIPKSKVTMSPAVFSVMNPTQNKTGAWYVQVPAGTPVGSYTGTLKVWNDEDADGQIDAGEAADTMTISIGVSELPSINVIQEPLNLYFIPAGRTKSGAFEIENTGNVDLGNLTILAVPAVLSPAGPGYSIPAPTISITSASNGYATGTVEVSVPEGQADAVYTGTQKVYVDVNENASFDDGTDPYTTFAVTITVGEKKISADSPVQFGTQNPGTTPTPVSFSLHNLKTLGISSGRWLAEGSGFPSSGLTFSPSQFTISPSDNLTCAAGLTIPQFQAPGPYVVTRTAFEDDNGNGLIDMYEASASFQVMVTVATYPLLNIVPATLVASAVAGGEAVTNVEFLIYNGGNVSFNSFAWTPAALAMGGDSLPAPPLESIVPSILGPGEYGTGTISIAPIDVEQHPGPYVGTQQLYDTVYQPLFAAAADSVDLTFIVRGPDLGFASTYQKIATSTFSASAPENRYIISGWVCPGSGSAAIGFFRADRNGYNAGFDGIIVASNSVLTRIGSPVDAGIIESQVAKNASYPDVTFTWYRVYAAFDYTFDPGVASTAWIAIKNYSPGNASYAVWFDGVQLEKYTIRGQKRPAPFTTGRKIVTPGPELSTEGGKSYFEW